VRASHRAARRHACKLLWLLLAFWPATGAGDTLFIRVAENEAHKPYALQLAIASYGMDRGNDKLRVDLVAAVHIGDQSYYADLNRRFLSYDAVLFELIAPADATIVRDDSQPRGLLSNTQIVMTNLLGLSFQLDEIDYTAGNFVHADLSPQELSESMHERGESLYVYFWRLFYASVNEYAKDPFGLRDMQTLSALFSADSGSRLKLALAYELLDQDRYGEILGADEDSALIGARNARAINVLRARLDSGDTRIAIFYGAAHLADMERRLIDELGFSYIGSSWVDAWRFDSQAAR